MKKYKEIKFMAGPVLSLVTRREDFVSKISVVDDESINELSSQGYEIIKIVTHHSDTKTATMIVMGKE